MKNLVKFAAVVIVALLFALSMAACNGNGNMSDPNPGGDRTMRKTLQSGMEHSEIVAAAESKVALPSALNSLLRMTSPSPPSTSVYEALRGSTTVNDATYDYFQILDLPGVVGMQVALYEVIGGTTSKNRAGYYWMISGAKATEMGGTGYIANQLYVLPSINCSDSAALPNVNAMETFRYPAYVLNNNMYWSPTAGNQPRIITNSYSSILTGTKWTSGTKIFQVSARLFAFPDDSTFETGAWQTNMVGQMTVSCTSPAPQTGIVLDIDELTLDVRGIRTLAATMIPVGTTVSWSTSNANVATVSNGVIMAVTEGTADIMATITVDGTTYSAKCVVTVVTKTLGTGTVTMQNWAFGQTASNPVINSETNPGSIATYIGRDETSYAETSAKPSAVGKYTVKVVFAENENYAFHTATADFEITKASGGAILIQNWTYGQTANNPDIYSFEEVYGTPGLEFTLINSGTAYEVSRGTADVAEIRIPAVYEGKPVTRIANYGFSAYTTLPTQPGGNAQGGQYVGFPEIASITLPRNLNSIGVSAFRGSALSSITIPASVTSIETYAFSACGNLVIWVQSAIPPTIESRSLGEQVGMRAVIVPSGFLSAYQTVWGRFYPANSQIYNKIYSETDQFVIDSGLKPDNDPAPANPSQYTVIYLGRDGTSYPESTIKPSAVGKYTVKVVFAETANYTAYTATANFEILAQSGGTPIDPGGDPQNPSDPNNPNNPSNTNNPNNPNGGIDSEKTLQLILTIIFGTLGLAAIGVGAVFFSRNKKALMPQSKKGRRILYGIIGGATALLGIDIAMMISSVLGAETLAWSGIGVMILYGILGVVVPGLILLLVLSFNKKLQKMLLTATELIDNVERTAEQKRWFYESEGYEDFQQEMGKGDAIGRSMRVAYLLATVGWIAATVICLISATFGIISTPILQIAGIMAFIYIVIIWFAGGRNLKKRLNTMDAQNSFNINYCLKCGDRAEISGKRFIATRYTHKTITRRGTPPSGPFRETGNYQMGAYQPEGEITSVTSATKVGGDGKAYNEFTAQIKFTHHVHKVTRDCEQCGYRWENEEDLPSVETQSSPQTVIYAGSVSVAKPDLPHVYCEFCHGKNKGEATRCEHCGNNLANAVTKGRSAGYGGSLAVHLSAGDQELNSYAELAKSGDVDAQYKLGYAYLYGTLGEKNLIKGIDWLQKAARNGSIKAKTLLRERSAAATEKEEKAEDTAATAEKQVEAESPAEKAYVKKREEGTYLFEAQEEEITSVYGSEANDLPRIDGATPPVPKNVPPVPIAVVPIAPIIPTTAAPVIPAAVIPPPAAIPVASAESQATEPAKQEIALPPKEAINTLREYKQLLDDGIITNKEFAAMKKQLLGL
ncbi:MAG: leucine-rich repeat protein [Firmicutes bacterium]|nr:leucine-rich repeat protein [Bacillota bacterium]